MAAEPALVLYDAHVVFTELYGVTVGAGEQLEVGERDLGDGEALVETGGDDGQSQFVLGVQADGGDERPVANHTSELA